MSQIAIIGNGIAGITAARHIRKLSDHRITVVSAESQHFFSRPALMYIYMGHMKYEHIKPYEDWFWEKNKINLVNGLVNGIDSELKQLTFSDGRKMNYDKLIIAVGSTYNKFGWPGQDLKGVSGMVSLQDLQDIEQYTEGIKRGVIVGGGLIGVELAEMLRTRNIPVTLLVRENFFWSNVLPKEEAQLVGRHLREHHVDLRVDTELKEILSDENGRVNAIITGDGEEIKCEFVGLTAGVHANINFLKNTQLETNRGILVNEYFETGIPDIYAIGDCAEHRAPPVNRRSVEQVWYTGRLHGETVAQTICGNPVKYQPGVWFNSAKFFDIEYQTYGWVWSEPKENEESFYWEHNDGKKCFRAVYDKNSGKLLGINIFGIRFRHEVCESWIKQEMHIDEVMAQLPVANFDPEFFAQYESEIIKKYNKERSKNIHLKAKKGVLAC
ncbi:MAG: FAD-dependent oxidoreductase [Flavobacteriales bacterium]|nr:MAG: FAD-dependent oxidoreductase [Flavobacteriales bacterium]